MLDCVDRTRKLDTVRAMGTPLDRTCHRLPLGPRPQSAVVSDGAKNRHDHRGGVGVTGGRDSPWNKRVGFEAPVSGGSTPLLLPHTRFAQVKGEAPAYCLSLCRRSSGHGMYSYACSGSGSSANGVMYRWMLGLARG